MVVSVADDLITRLHAQNPDGVTPSILLAFLGSIKERPEVLTEATIESVLLMCSSHYTGVLSGFNNIKRAVYVFSNYTKDQYYALYLYCDKKYRGILNSSELISALRRINIGLTERACASMLEDYTQDITANKGITYRTFMQVLVKCIIFRRQFLDALEGDKNLTYIRIKR